VNATFKGPLSGLKVLEFGQIAAGPFAGSLLADLGADVVKVEKPNGGDDLRQWPPLTPGERGDPYSENFASVNRNKRSLCADLKDPAQIERLLTLCARSDVLLENYRSGVLDRLGLGYERVRSVAPKLVYCSVNGYGQSGPYAGKGAFDATIQAISGVMSVTGEAGRAPVKCGVPIGDFGTGLYAAYCILAAVLRARETGEGAQINCSMLGAMLGIAALQTSEFFGTGKAPKARGSAHPRSAPYQAFQAADAPFMLAAGNDKLWHDVCEVVGRPELKADERFLNHSLRARNQAELAAVLQPIFATRSKADWLKALDARGVPCAPINDYAELLSDPHVVEKRWVRRMELPNGKETRTMAFPADISGYEFQVYRSPPLVGQHTEEVFAEWVSEAGRGERCLG